jgi:hypothetical protein
VIAIASYGVYILLRKEAMKDLFFCGEVRMQSVENLFLQVMLLYENRLFAPVSLYIVLFSIITKH